MQKSFIIMVLIGLLTLQTAAQEFPELPIFDADEIFLEGITVLEQFPVLVAVDPNRELNYFDPSTKIWQTVAYPDEVDRMWYVVARWYL